MFTDLFEVLFGILVLDVFGWDVDFFVVAVHIVIGVCFGDGFVEFNTQGDASLICPAPSDILDCVATSPDHNHRDAEPKHIIQTRPMTLNTQIEVT